MEGPVQFRGKRTMWRCSLRNVYSDSVFLFLCLWSNSTCQCSFPSAGGGFCRLKPVCTFVHCRCSQMKSKWRRSPAFVEYPSSQLSNCYPFARKIRFRKCTLKRLDVCMCLWRIVLSTDVLIWCVLRENISELYVCAVLSTEGDEKAALIPPSSRNRKRTIFSERCWNSVETDSKATFCSDITATLYLDTSVSSRTMWKSCCESEYNQQVDFSQLWLKFSPPRQVAREWNSLAPLPFVLAKV